MRRYLTIGAIVVSTVLAGPAALAAPAPRSPDPSQAPAQCTPPGAGQVPDRGEGRTPRALPASGGPVAASQPARTAGARPGPGDPVQDDPGGAACAEQPGTSAGHETSAAARYGWGEPNRVDEFDGGLGEDWSVYDGPGHAGNGRRMPDAVSVENGSLTITGDSEGNTAGMAWSPGQKHGRWEGRVKAPGSDETYNALLLLWPDAEDFPEGGEIDFMEMMDHTRQKTNIFLHYGEDNDQVDGEVQIDATQWHNWAVEWTPTHVAAFVDGEEWWRTTDTDILPPGSMHLCIQLDWFPDDGGGDVQESAMHVDWVTQYPIDAGDAIDGAAEDAGRTAADIGGLAHDTVDGVLDEGSDVAGVLRGPSVEGAPDGPAAP